MSSASIPLLPTPEQMAASLRAALPNFKQVQWVDSTSSTNADLLAKARRGGHHLARPWLLGAHLQEGGRGRAGRTWQNRAGANLMFSCAFDVFLPPKQLPTLSPLAGVAACEALRSLIEPAHQTRLVMKWPNDVHWQFAKLAGILVEITRASTSKLAADHHVAIVGIGINLEDARALSQSLNRQVADWSEVTAQDAQAAAASASTMVAAIAHAWYASFNAAIREGFDALPARYAQVDALAGQHVNVLDDGRIIHAGIACGINTFGQLLVRTADGDKPISVGEISVRAQT
ncbi:biotin--[acetyl-CoA-carboxylase] ligase [Paralcaligenes sp. KSB-10]|jgi:BirA family biotin operon repressor/biotin-[acetyl-CoA-carboxylase] ligase|uniref:biotin--[acetyl-CoA-carboxylase] ligase n=1 Tax=Paralcaligenes sp. KSB-10 TaxID=2901142 RepID=UPI001E46E5EF|nr:biotin--[acetyl-CoA-carboxylase] ligase [Paralcaligenes sp. KSB-10]UHL63194.1 biotin--[acetyl-CoA-carboxylase] ligase [Paralcaligenes sp. KSB-10]